SADDDDAGRRKLSGGRKEAGLRCAGECGEFRDVRRRTYDSDASDRVSILEERNAPRIHGCGIAVPQIDFPWKNAEAEIWSADRARWIDCFAGIEGCVERAAAICVFDSVQVSVWSHRNARREVNAANETHGATGEWRLIVAEQGSSPRQGNGEFVAIDDSAEI